jgi:hypothetical protein
LKQHLRLKKGIGAERSGLLILAHR